MNKTQIEWVVNPDGTNGYTWNPISGCLHNCSYCYARKIARRFGDDFTPKYHTERYKDAEKLKKPSTIFVGSMGDMFDSWVDWRDQNKTGLMSFPKRHTYLFLTKNPNGYVDFLKYGYKDDNFWYGITLDNLPGATNRLRGSVFYDLIVKEKIKSFISLEPMLYFHSFYDYEDLFKKVDWIILGSLTINGKPIDNESIVLALQYLTAYYPEKLFIKDSICKLYNIDPDENECRELPYLRKDEK